MKVVHFAQLDKDTILLCAESKQHLLLLALKTLCIKLHSSTIVTELSSASPWCVQVSATSRLHINLLILLVIMHTQPFNGPLSGTTQVSRYQKGKTNLDFTEARDSQWQWHQLGHMQVCTSLQTDNHASTPPLSFLQAGCPSCRPTNSIKALKALQQQRPFNGLRSRTTRVGRYQKKFYSPTHTHPDHRASFIIFLHLQRSMASSLFNLRA